MKLATARSSTLLLTIALALSLLATPAQAAKTSVSMTPVPLSLVAGQRVTVSGKTAGGLKGAKVKIQIKTGKNWKTVKTVKSKKKGGAWTATFKAPKSTPKMSIRALSGSKKTKVQATTVVAPLNLSIVGPGTRILGVDLSRWQNSGQPIDFNRMAAAGVAYAFIKGSDGLASEDVLAVPSVTAWAPSAKAAQATARLVSLGGYDDRTLPYVLDIESVNATITKDLVTLWTFTWLDAMQAATGRVPIIYSYRSFLASRFLSDPATIDKLRNYHLWLAQPGDPADPAVQVGQGLNGAPCYASAWKQSDCSYVWTFWQYTNSGDREIYGIPWQPSAGECPADVTLCFAGRGTGRNHLDLNVFNGSAADLTALVNGSWARTPAEYR